MGQDRALSATLRAYKIQTRQKLVSRLVQHCVLCHLLAFECATIYGFGEDYV